MSEVYRDRQQVSSSVIVTMLKFIQIRATFESSRISSLMWQIEIKHAELHKYRVIKGETREIMQLRAQMQLRSWDEQWERVQTTQRKRQAQLDTAYNRETKKHLAAELSGDAQKALDALEHLLTGVLEEDHAIDWSVLLDNSEYTGARPTAPEAEPIP